MTHRVIAKLDIKGPNLVKGIHLEGLRVLGNPEDFAEFYYVNGIDELIYLDVVASLFERNSLTEVISRTASGNFIPLTVGGGLRSVDDIRSVLRAGADKVSLNTAAIRDPNLIRDAAHEFGASTVVIAIEAILRDNGEYFAYIDNGREETGVEVTSWARKAQKLGAGEILLTSVDRDGTGTGLDLDLISCVAAEVSIPVIAHGGAGMVSDISDGITAGADAVALASMLHYGVLETHFFEPRFNPEDGNQEFLLKKSRPTKMTIASIQEVKSHLYEAGYDCRYPIDDK